jgi:hypothetical protein
MHEAFTDVAAMQERNDLKESSSGRKKILANRLTATICKTAESGHLIFLSIFATRSNAVL